MPSSMRAANPGKGIHVSPMSPIPQILFFAESITVSLKWAACSMSAKKFIWNISHRNLFVVLSF